MSRIKGGVAAKKRHKRVLKDAKGYWGQRSNIFRRARETLLRAMANAYAGRKVRKRDFRQLFISRINAGCKANGCSYSTFMCALKKQNILLNRKMLSQLAIFEPEAFAGLITMAKKQTS
jgi:large subunit ribosomal protein L20